MSIKQPDFNDPITLQVMWDRLVFIADQADSALGRTAFSPIVRENHDYVTVVLEASVRLPAEVRGDVQSMVASNEVMSRELLRFMDEYGLDDLEGLASSIHGRSERFMRKAIAAWPQGSYKAEVTIDGFESDVKLCVDVQV